MKKETTQKLMTNWRWWMIVLLFTATTVNYMDRQVLSLTWKDFIAPEFHWTDNDYGTITAFFSIIYAICMLFIGKFVDWMGTKKGYLRSIGIWSFGAVIHAGCGWAAMHIEGYESIASMSAIEAESAAATAIASVSVRLFLAARGILALGEAGNFPAAIKTTAEYFPKKDRAIATITGIGGMAGGISSFLINKGAGMLFTYTEKAGEAFTFIGFDGKEAGYMIVFCICATAYLIAWSVMKALVPKYSKIDE